MENHIINVKPPYKLCRDFDAPWSDKSLITIFYLGKYGKYNTFRLGYDNIFIDDTSVSFEFSDKNNFDTILNNIKNELLTIHGEIKEISVTIQVNLQLDINNKCYIKENGVLVPIKEIYVKENGALVPIKQVYVKENGVLVKIF